MIIGIGLAAVAIACVLYWVSAYRLVSGVARLQVWTLSRGFARGGFWQQRALDFCASRVLVWAARVATPRLRIESWWQKVTTTELQRQTRCFMAACDGLAPLPRSLAMQQLVTLRLQHRAMDIYESEVALLRLHNDRVEHNIESIEESATIKATLAVSTVRFSQLHEAVAYFGYHTWPVYEEYQKLADVLPLSGLLATAEQTTP